MTPARPRVAWFAGTRSEVLQLGPYYNAFAVPGGLHDAVHWLVSTGEQGMAAVQAMDYLNIHPEEECELRHPAEDYGIRLHSVMADVESFMRRHRATHAVASGFGATAAAVALIAHSRDAQAIWIKPRDPAELIPRLRWESGIESIIRGVPEVRILGVEPPEEGDPSEDGSVSVQPPLIPGRRMGALPVLISIGRRQWGEQGDLAKVVLAVAEWARQRPEADFVVIRSLDARLEGQLKSMPNRPANLLGAAPMPLPEYLQVLHEARLILTDSFNLAGEGIAANIPVLALGEIASASTAVHHVTPGDLQGEKLLEVLSRSLVKPPEECRCNTRDWSPQESLQCELAATFKAAPIAASSFT